MIAPSSLLQSPPYSRGWSWRHCTRRRRQLCSSNARRTLWFVMMVAWDCDDEMMIMGKTSSRIVQWHLIGFVSWDCFLLVFQISRFTCNCLSLPHRCAPINICAFITKVHYNLYRFCSSEWSLLLLRYLTSFTIFTVVQCSISLISNTAKKPFQSQRQMVYLSQMVCSDSVLYNVHIWQICWWYLTWAEE